MRSNDLKLAGAAIVLSLLVSACGGASAQIPGANGNDERAAAAVRQVLVEADDIARTYGQRHLGHYLDLTASKLERAGLEIPPGMTITLRTTHISYCIKTRSSVLSESHAWTVATTGSSTGGPSPDDKCRRSRY